MHGIRQIVRADRFMAVLEEFAISHANVLAGLRCDPHKVIATCINSSREDFWSTVMT